MQFKTPANRNLRRGAAARAGLRWAATVVILLGLTLPTPGGAWGDGHWDIRVASDRVEVNFPREIVFHLGAEADREIVEVRLNYRNARGGISAYTYPAFNPARSINATVRLPTGGAQYLAPGSRVEYYYSIVDSAGNRHQTSPKVVEYLDNRFQWEETQAGPVTLLHHDLPQRQVDGAARNLEADLKRASDLLQPPAGHRMRGFVYNDLDEAEAAFPHLSEALTERQVFHGYAFPATGVFLAVGLEPGLLAHEAGHLLLGQTVGASSVVPRWLDEGFASYVEPDSRPYSGRSLNPHSPSLLWMSTLSGTPRDIFIFYEKSVSVVAYLIETHGAPSFRRFIRELAQGRNTDEALLQVYGFDIAGLDARWADSSQGRSLPSSGRPRSGPPSPFLYIDAWLLGGLVLVVSVVVLAKFVWGKLRPREETEDDW